MNFFSTLPGNISAFFSANPTVFFIQAVLLGCGFLVVYLVVFATRDIMLRTDYFLFQIICIVLVAALPMIGFLIYLLVRPSTTIFQRKLKGDLESVVARFGNQKKKSQKTIGN